MAQIASIAARAETARTAPVPRAPATMEDTGLTVDQIRQLFVKALYREEATGTTRSGRLRLPYVGLETLGGHIRAERLIEVKGASGSGTAGYRYALTDLGRDRAQQYLEANQYVGPAPVPLATYVAAMQALQAARGYLDRERLRSGFSHLIVEDEVLDQLGPAVNAGKAIFLYGPPGNGKTVIAEGMGRALGGDMYVPHAIDIDGEIVTVFDPVNHEAVDPADAAPEEQTIVRVSPRDGRWVRIKRPSIVVGGELTLDMLDLAFNPISKYHEAPLQMK